MVAPNLIENPSQVNLNGNTTQFINGAGQPANAVAPVTVPTDPQQNANRILQDQANQRQFVSAKTKGGTEKSDSLALLSTVGAVTLTEENVPVAGSNGTCQSAIITINGAPVSAKQYDTNTIMVAGPGSMQVYGAFLANVVFCERQFKPYFRARIKTGTFTADQRWIVGLTAGALGKIFFGYDTSLGETTWKCVHFASPTTVRSESGVTFAANTVYVLEWLVNAAGNFEYYINGTLVFTATATIPADTDLLSFDSANPAILALSLVNGQAIRAFWADLYISQN